MTRKSYPSDRDDQYMLNLPDGMRASVNKLAKANRRSMNSQIVTFIADGLARTEAPAAPLPNPNDSHHPVIQGYLEVLVDKVGRLEAMVTELADRALQAERGDRWFDANRRVAS